MGGLVCPPYFRDVRLRIDRLTYGYDHREGTGYGRAGMSSFGGRRFAKRLAEVEWMDGLTDGLAEVEWTDRQIDGGKRPLWKL